MVRTKKNTYRPIYKPFATKIPTAKELQQQLDDTKKRLDNKLRNTFKMVEVAIIQLRKESKRKTLAMRQHASDIRNLKRANDALHQRILQLEEGFKSI